MDKDYFIEGVFLVLVVFVGRKVLVFFLINFYDVGIKRCSFKILEKVLRGEKGLVKDKLYILGVWS